MLRIVAYDIASPRRLARIAKTCLDYGIRIEKSVFECDLLSDQFEMLWESLKKLANEEADYLVAYPICSECERKIEIYGRSRHLEPSDIRVF